MHKKEKKYAKIFLLMKNKYKKEDVKVIGNDVKHIKNVLREKVGNELIICNTSNKKRLFM